MSSQTQPVKKICFLLNAVSISGGVYVVFQHAVYLQTQGFDVTIAVQNEFDNKTFEWHPEAKFLKIIALNKALDDSFNLVIATFWNTIFDLPKFNTTRLAYFVQSIESRFYEVSDPRHSLALQTYRLPIYFISIADWIGAYLNNIGAPNVWIVKNGIRKELYSPNTRSKDFGDRPKGLRVLVEGPFGVPYKNTALAIKLAKNLGIKDIWVLTSTPVRRIPWVSKVFSQVPIENTPEIYQSCDVLLKLSTVEGLFGPPLEMFHCGGTAAVLEVSGHDEYIVGNQNAYVIRREFFEEDIKQLKVILQNKEKLSQLKKGALNTAAFWPSWNDASLEMVKSINQILEFPENSKVLLKAIASMSNPQKLGRKINFLNIAFMTLKRALPTGFLNSIRTLKIYFEVVSVSMRPK